MTDFKNYLMNGSYIGAYNASKEGKKDSAKKGLVFIEDDSDQFFWETFINTYYPDQYIVQSSIIGRPGIRGKRALENLYSEANHKVLIAVDSDYDFMCPNHRPDCNINQNKYILHTFSHCRESALLNKKYLSIFFNSVKYTIPHNIDITSFLNKFSILAFHGLIFFCNELNTGNTFNLIEEDFNSCFNILDQNIVKSNELSLDEDLLDIIQDRLHKYFSNLNYTQATLESSEKYLNSIGVNHSNAYRFISGHVLHDLILKIHEQLINILCSQEIEKIKNEFTGKEVGQRISQLKQTFKSQTAIDTFLHSYPIKNDDEIHEKIIQRLTAIKS